MALDLLSVTQVLERTPRTLEALLLDLPDEWTRIDEGPDTWSPFDVVGHLIDGEENDWVVRVRIILSSDNEHRFQPFDRFRHLQTNVDARLPDLIERFGELRRRNLDDMAQLELTNDDLERTGIHPEFGRVTLAQLLATWVTHDLTHIAQISRIMAKRHREEVGPWRRFLPLLDR